MKKTKILRLIQLIRESHDVMEDIFKEGSCLNFHMILKHVYPEAKAWYNIDHIVSEIDGRFYDITGEVSTLRIFGENYQPFDKYYSKARKKKAIQQMYKYQNPTICKRTTISEPLTQKKKKESTI